MYVVRHVSIAWYILRLPQEIIHVPPDLDLQLGKSNPQELIRPSNIDTQLVGNSQWPSRISHQLASD